MLRTGYEYFRRYDTLPWVQALWSLTYYNAWYTVVADDPMTWFYYNWGISGLPVLSSCSSSTRSSGPGGGSLAVARHDRRRRAVG